MTKYKVGDKVIIIDSDFKEYMGKVYTVVSTDKEVAWINLFSENTMDAVEDFWITKATKLHKALA